MTLPWLPDVGAAEVFSAHAMKTWQRQPCDEVFDEAYPDVQLRNIPHNCLIGHNIVGLLHCMEGFVGTSHLTHQPGLHAQQITTGMHVLVAKKDDRVRFWHPCSARTNG